MTSSRKQKFVETDYERRDVARERYLTWVDRAQRRFVGRHLTFEPAPPKLTAKVIREGI